MIKLILVMILGVGCYFLGKSHAETKIITKQVEVIKYVEKQRGKIHMRPNADRSELLELMHSNKL